MSQNFLATKRLSSATTNIQPQSSVHLLFLVTYVFIAAKINV